MRYIYYWEGDRHKARRILVRKTAKAALEEAIEGGGLIITIEEGLCYSVEGIINVVEAKIKAKDYLDVRGVYSDSTKVKEGAPEPSSHWNRACKRRASRSSTA